MTGKLDRRAVGVLPRREHGAEVVQFNKTNGAILKMYDEPTLAGTGAGYAFAHWGGDYWVFLIRTRAVDDGVSSQRHDRRDREHDADQRSHDRRCGRVDLRAGRPASDLVDQCPDQTPP